MTSNRNVQTKRLTHLQCSAGETRDVSGNCSTLVPRESSRPKSLGEIVSAYIRDRRKGLLYEIRCFEQQRRLQDAIRAAFCLMPNQKRYSHQRRLSKAVLKRGARRLQRRAKETERAPDFAALHSIVVREVGQVAGIGPLTVYDVALRVGAFLGKVPDLVYLHAGTKAGAAVFGLSGEGIDPKELPAPFSRLTAAECEDCLCGYKDQLRDVMRTAHSTRSEAKKRDNKQNGRKGGLVKSRKKTIAASRNARRRAPGAGNM